MTLFLAASFLVGDFITLVYNLLGGELTMRFALKVATVAIIAGVGGGLWILGSPAQERVNRLDSRRVGDLQQIEHAVNLHWTRQRRLPASLDELSAEAGVRISLRDPARCGPAREGSFAAAAGLPPVSSRWDARRRQ